MAARADHLMDFLLQAGFSALIVSFVATMAMIATRQPARRLTIARASLIALLIVPLLTLVEIAPRFSILESLRAVLPPPTSPSSSGTSVPAGVSAYQGWKPAVLAIYAVGLAWGLGGLFVSLSVAEWLRRHSEQADPDVQSFGNELAELAGIRPPEVRFSHRVRRPVLYGLRHPFIVLPHEFDRATDSMSLRLAILHECCHLRTLDPGFSALATITRTIWFTLPTVWWIREQMRLDQEFRADGRASTLYGPDFSYAKSLVAFAEPGEGSPIGGGGRALLPRVLMLVRCPFRIEPSPPLWWRVSIVPCIVLLTIMATSLSLTDVQPLRSLPLKPLVTTPTPRTFQMERLTLRADPENPADSTTVLPTRLPEEFDLRLEVRTRPSALSQFRFAGYSFPSGDFGSSDRDVEQWIPVRIERRTDGSRGWIHGHLRECHPPRVKHDNLTLRSPSRQAVRYRSLTLSW